MDKKFLNNVKAQKKQIKSSISVMAPKELCEHLRLSPADVEKLAAEISPFS